MTRALDKKLLRDFWHVKGQALAIIAVIACGVAIMIMTFGAMTSLQQTRDSYYEKYRFAQIFSQLKRAPNRIARDIAELPGVATVETRVTHYAPLNLPGLPRPAAAYLVSLPDGGQLSLNQIALRQGRLPLPERDEVVMSENMAEALGYVPGQRISITLNGRQRAFTIVGVALSPEFVYLLGPGQILPDDKTFGVLWLNRSIMEAAYDMDGAFNDISVSLAPRASQDKIIARMDKILEPYGGGAAYGRADQTSHAFVDQELDQLQTMAAVLPPIFLGVAAFLIHMVMSRLIDTEREAIGLLKSFGYTNWEIGWHYLKFTLLIALAGVIAGCALGLWLGDWMTGLYQDYFRFPFLYYRIDRLVFSVTVAISLLSALAGTGSAVARAVGLAPATAMQPPAPAIYRHSPIDWLSLHRIVSVPMQMILRHILRWPLRALLTVCGVAMATMLLVGLLFFFDAIDKLVDDFYFRTNRHDITIGLLDRRSDRISFDTARLPGVRAVEPVLEVPARLSHEHLAQRLAISGFDPGSRFRAMYDSSGQPFTVPRNGIVLSNKLADILKVRAGDGVRIEILEGARGKATVTVVGITEEYVGLSAYMARPALAALSGENGVTGLQILADPAQEPALLKHLKDMPAVATVSTRGQAIASLRELMARSMTIVLNFFIALGAVIALGVVYNAARIGLSERGREFASLRVLGFTRTEVTYILIGELALLVLVALPFGCALGYWLAYAMSEAMETKLFRLPFVVEPSTYGLAALVVLVSAAISSIAVARRIGRLDLVSVLKTRE